MRPHVDQGLAFRLTSGHMTGHSIVRSGSAICRVPTPTHPVDPTVRGWRQRVSIGPHCEQDGGRFSPRSLHMDTFPVRTFMRHASWAAPAEIAYGPSRCASAIDTFIPTSTPTRTNATPIATVFGVMSFPHVFRHQARWHASMKLVKNFGDVQRWDRRSAPTQCGTSCIASAKRTG